MVDEIKLFEEQGNMIIVGKKRVGKTLLGWLLSLKFSKFNRQIYVYRFPKPHLLETFPFYIINITEMSQISNLRDAVILIDEAHRVFPVGEKRVNGQLEIFWRIVDKIIYVLYWYVIIHISLIEVFLVLLILNV